MKIHNLKILIDFAGSIAVGNKLFEIRENDRGYQKGDFVKFKAINKYGIEIRHAINNMLFQITYVMSGYGIKEGFVVFGIKEYIAEIREKDDFPLGTDAGGNELHPGN